MVDVRRPAFAVLLAACLLAAPTVPAQSLSQRLGDLRFPEIIVDVAPNLIVVTAERGSLSGQTAGDLRECIDAQSSCPDSSLAALSDGNADGFVDEAEVDGFSSALVAAINLAGGSVAEFRRNLRELATIDGHGADSARFQSIRIEGAEGAVSKTDNVYFTIRVEVKFPEVPDASEHRVTIQREQSDLELADRIVIAAADGWTLPRDTILPDNLRSLHRDDGISGTQDQLEGAEPMTFEIHRAQGDGGNVWLWVISLLLVGGGIGAFLLARARRGV